MEVNEPYRIELTQGDLMVIRRALGRAPHDQARPIIDCISAQIDSIDAERAARGAPAQAALLRPAPGDED